MVPGLLWSDNSPPLFTPSVATIPDLPPGPPPPPTCRDTSLELAITALLTWLTRAAQLQALGLVVRDKHVKVILGK